MAKKARIVVIGDVMLDIYRYGDVDRISPEAPVPVVLLDKTEKNLGGAGNTFANLLSLGASCILFGMVGRDHYGLVEIPTLIHEHYQEAEVQLHNSGTHCTIVKERIIARGQQICRVDREIKKDVNVNVSFLNALEKELLKADVVIISDYAKGFYSEAIQDSVTACKKKRGYSVVLDPHPENAHFYESIDYATPNMKEYLEIGGNAFWDMGCTGVLRTEGANGMTYISQTDFDYHIGTHAQEIFDVSGAGDTVCAVFSYMLAHRFSAKQSMEVANRCAGIVVAKRGTVPIQRSEFDRMMRGLKQ
jgi:D-beta-D-heptose 7-phosphate kinase/D-beta-D-heptose 1-phosphate adenosyltransferase